MYQVFYTDLLNCRGMRKFKSERHARFFISRNRWKWCEWDLFKAAQGFHSTAQAEYRIAHHNEMLTA